MDPDSVLILIKQVIRDYHYSLDSEFRGEIAAECMTRIESILGMPYINKAEQKRRKGE